MVAEGNRMQKIDKTVARETVYIAAVTFVLSVAMQMVFAVIHRWDYTVLLGNILGFVAAVLNFFLMGITVQKAVVMSPEDAKKRVKLSQSLRLMMLGLFAIVAGVFKCFSLISFVIPLLFPRIGVTLRPLFDKDKE